jgi:exopolysaccharide production protein ExoY
MEDYSTTILGRSDTSLASGLAPPAFASDGQRAFKRTLDVLGASTFLLLFLPLLLGVVVLLLIFQGRPLIYGHARIGHGGRAFRCFKFRTMVNDGDRVLATHLASDAAARREWEATRKLRDDPRVTPLGRTMRKLSIDELPQFLNVLRGEMSLVGPRPIVEAECRHYGSHFSVYCSVRPGITGLWQVSGRSDLSWDDAVRLDLYYVENWSLALDLQIIWKTMFAVAFARGAY